MSKRKSVLGEVFDSIGSAIAVAAAVESGRPPQAYHLRRLGIDPQQYRAIGRR